MEGWELIILIWSMYFGMGIVGNYIYKQLKKIYDVLETIANLIRDIKIEST